jgi:hypothetical protein
MRENVCVRALVQGLKYDNEEEKIDAVELGIGQKGGGR